MISSTKMTAVRSAAACGLSGSRLRGTGLSGVESVRPGAFVVLPRHESAKAAHKINTGSKINTADWLIERPTKAPAAAAAQASAYAFAANGAGLTEPTVTTQQHQMMRAFRGLEPWRDPA